ncbi:FAD-dependent oxidoreductase [uncultured Boseongicola sp.]|jgi:fumarate reductase flavoprotein subunit|uniref:FAD-dependent oxidoreductase n=1 Tax=uncultured Boseongicola sp. TaxID=1648499 RepID=UPI00261DF021|nr:FAD-dependent oxidoreductase [uncultured Boseongicola sp.]
MPQISHETPTFGFTADVVIIGAGASGLTAALAAAEQGAEVVVLERDASPSGSTSMSSGFVPAPGTLFQHAIGVTDDTPDLFCADLMAKSYGKSDERLTRLAARTIGPAMEWLADAAQVEWHVLDDFLYPGHTRHRMHAVPEKTGAALEARLLAAVAEAEIALVTEALAETLYVDEAGKALAVGVSRPDGSVEVIACKTLILACNGYGGNADMVAEYIPQIAQGEYYGHAGNTGHAVVWGQALGAELKHLSGYQGHGSLAHPHGILISWALMMQGAIQVNTEGRRFSNEMGGYSEQAVKVIGQPGGIAWNIFDKARHDFAVAGFPDYLDAVDAGAIRSGETVAELAEATGLPSDAIAETIAAVQALAEGEGTDPLGRDFSNTVPLAGPFYAVKVTGALFHTQGGLVIADDARVMRVDGTSFPNLYASGGAACGVSGPSVEGYLSGNGLLTAIAYGYLAGRHAAAQTTGEYT